VAQSFFERGAYRNARSLLHTARALDSRLNRARGLAEEYRLLAEISALSSDFDSAFVYYARSEEQYKALTDRASARSMILKTAALHMQMGDVRTAYDMYSEYLRLATIFKDDEGIRAVQLTMLPALRLLEKEEELTQTVAALQKSYMEAGNAQMQARAHFESALTFIHRGNDSLALDPLLQALTFAGRAGDSLMVIRVLSTLANTYEAIGATGQAFETFTEALTRTDHTAGSDALRLEALVRVGNVYFRHGHVSEATRFYRAALNAAIAMKDRLAEGYLFIQLGICNLAAGAFSEAVKSIESAASLFEGAGYSPGLGLANMCLGLAYQQSGRSNDATDFYKKGVALREATVARPGDVYEECERIALQGRRDSDILVELLLRIGKNDDAFWYAERSRRRSLFAKLSALELRTRDELTNSLLKQLHHARALQAGAENQLALLLARGPDDAGLRKLAAERISSSMQSAEELGSAIAASAPLLEPAARINSMAIVDVQRALPPGVLLLRSIPTSRSVYAFAISNARVQVQMAAVDRQHLEEVAAAYMHEMQIVEALSDSPAVQRATAEATAHQLSAQLYAALLRPVESQIAGARTVLVVPDDAIASLPLHALRRGGAGSTYAIEQTAFMYIPAASLLRQRNTPAPATSVVGIGYSPAAAWDVEYELRDIRAFFKDARLYFGDQASLPTLMRESGHVLHMAADFRYSRMYPGNASVMLADPRIRDIAKEYSWGEFLGTSAFATVVLSHLKADTVAIDELLPSLFLMNGSSTVMANPLPASRKAKKVFGELFYTALLAGQSADEAYRQAILAMIRDKELTAPLGWVPFALWRVQP
jgi:tetratricopeptide (TPR) repeat protein